MCVCLFVMLCVAEEGQRDILCLCVTQCVCVSIFVCMWLEEGVWIGYRVDVSV